MLFKYHCTWRDSPWITWELSFRKKLYRYLGMKADMQAYARAADNKGEDEVERREEYQRYTLYLCKSTTTPCFKKVSNTLTFIVEIQPEKWCTK